MAEKSAVETRVNALIVKVLGFPAAHALDPAARFYDDLKADSLDMVTLAMAVEDEFGVEVSDDEAATCETVAQMIALVGAKVA